MADIVAVSGPVVSVVVPVFNAEPYVRQAVDSVLRQTLGPERVELILVDDGSTDGSSELLDSYAADFPSVRVVHQPPSGAPGRPRNVGVDHARGRYVFFLDADDYLGLETLERLVGMAERNGSDVVMGKFVGVDGRLAPSRPYRQTVDRAELRDVYSSLAVMRLFRRSLIDRVGVRFDEQVKGGEDAPYTAELMLNADVISVVADYPCYYYRNRAGSVTKRVRTEHPAEHLDQMASRAALLARLRPPGAERDALMSRHIADLLRPFKGRWLALPDDDRERVFRQGQDVIRRYYNHTIEPLLTPYDAVRSHCLLHGLQVELEDVVRHGPRSAYEHPVIEGDVVYAGFPHFRDGTGIPDHCFRLRRVGRALTGLTGASIRGARLQLRGHGYLSGLGGRTSVVLERWPDGLRRVVPTRVEASPGRRDRRRRYPTAGFSADIDLNPEAAGERVAAGLWRISLELKEQGICREVPARLDTTLDPASTIGVRRGAVTARLDQDPDGSLTLHVGRSSRLSALLLVGLRRIGRDLRRAGSSTGTGWPMRRVSTVAWVEPAMRALARRRRLVRSTVHRWSKRRE